jgi:hypothetical protein
LEEDVGGILTELHDVGTPGFKTNCDILQISTKRGETAFGTYVNPSRQVCARATAANGFVNCNGELEYCGVEIQSVPMKLALVSFTEWTELFKKICIAVRNLTFDGPRLFRAISKYSFADEFAEVTCGFTDSLHVFRKIAGRKGKNGFSVKGLANSKNINTNGAHNAIYNCEIFGKLP